MIEYRRRLHAATLTRRGGWLRSQQHSEVVHKGFIYQGNDKLGYGHMATVARMVHGQVGFCRFRFLRYRRVKIQGRGRVGDRSTVQAYVYYCWNYEILLFN